MGTQSAVRSRSSASTFKVPRTVVDASASCTVRDSTPVLTVAPVLPSCADSPEVPCTSRWYSRRGATVLPRPRPRSISPSSARAPRA